MSEPREQPKSLKDRACLSAVAIIFLVVVLLLIISYFLHKLVMQTGA